MTISLRLSDQEDAVIRKYAELNGITVSDLIRQSVFERIEDEYDLQSYAEALAAFHADPKTYSLDEVERELGFK